METQLNTLYGQFSRKIDTYSSILLRVSLAIVYIWFGALKVFKTSPAEELVQETVYWLEPSIFVPLLGVAELMIGIGLLIKKMDANSDTTFVAAHVRNLFSNSYRSKIML